jgi:release factor glutamine methyltransferase
VASPEHDARALALHVLGLTKPSELAGVETLDEARYAALIAERAGRVPLQHLTGSTGFRWLELQVGPGVFVPRPETESVVQWAIDHAAPHPLVVDLCAGTGAIALSLAHEVPGARVHAVELDPAALLWTRRNAEGTGVQVHQGDAKTALSELDGTVDLVVSNPPYLPDSDRAVLAPEALQDPDVALFSGADGLDLIRDLERAAYRLLKPGGLAVVEHGDGQGVSAPALFAGSRWDDVQDHQDLTGRDRFVTARKATP